MIEIALLFCCVGILALLVYVILLLKNQKSIQNDSHIIETQEHLNAKTTEALLNAIKAQNELTKQHLLDIANIQAERIKDIGTQQDKLLKANTEQLEKATGVLRDGLDKLQKDNSLQLEKMRATVDEKLNESLQTRLNQSFELISKRLQDVYEGLGEMKTLASGVGDLKKVLTNVKTRGGWGEYQLGALLEQMLAPNQYMAQVQTGKSADRVDYAVVIPSASGSQSLLPIDSKFPMEDYQRLLDAFEASNAAEIEIQSKNIEKRIKKEAKKIKEKYINPPATTDFALMYLPVEGLYAEVLRRPSLSEFVQRNYKIIICGPTTLSAMLSSLQLGFRTITIEKRSTEIWNLLSTFKFEFGKFVDLLDKTQKKLSEASKQIESATKKSRTIERRLKSVSSDVLDTQLVYELEQIEKEDEE
jgi:DNA recombination protein RmuC